MRSLLLIEIRMNLTIKIGKLVTLVWFCILLSLGARTSSGATTASNPGVSVEAEISDPVVEVGQSLEYEIKVEGKRPANPPVILQLPGMMINKDGESSSIQLSSVNGHVGLQQSIIYRYTITPTQTGKFEIPGQDLQINNESVHVPAVTFEVLKAGAGTNSGGNANVQPNAGGSGVAPGAQTQDQDDSAQPTRADQLIRLEINIPKKTAYVGETVPLELRMIVTPGVRLLEADQNPILNGEGFETGRFTPPQVTSRNQYAPRTVIYKTFITPAKAGELSIGPSDVLVAVQLPMHRPKRQARRSPFGSFTDDVFNNFPNTFLSPVQQVKLRSESIKLDVQRLPSRGKPANFSDAVGHFNFVSAKVDPETAHVGDPVTVTLVIQGRGNFNRIQPPMLDGKEFKAYPPNSKFLADDDVGLSGTKTYEQTLVPQTAGNKKISYHFSYFDPDTKKYVTLKSTVLPIKVLPAIKGNEPNATAAAASGAGSPSASPSPAKASSKDGFHSDIKPAIGSQSSVKSIFYPLLTRPIFWVVQALCFAGLIAFTIFLYRKSRLLDPAALEKNARAKLHQDSLYALQHPTNRKNFYQAAANLVKMNASKSVSPDLQTSVQTILEKHNELLYSNDRHSIDYETLSKEEKESVLKAIHELVGCELSLK